MSHKTENKCGQFLQSFLPCLMLKMNMLIGLFKKIGHTPEFSGTCKQCGRVNATQLVLMIKTPNFIPLNFEDKNTKNSESKLSNFTGAHAQQSNHSKALLSKGTPKG